MSDVDPIAVRKFASKVEHAGTIMMSSTDTATQRAGTALSGAAADLLDELGDDS